MRCNLYKVIFVSAIAAISLALQAASLEQTLNQQLQAKLPLSGAGIEAEIRSDKVILSGSALNLQDRLVAEMVARNVTKFTVLNEIQIDDAYLRDGF
jgi:hypothetical protein